MGILLMSVVLLLPIANVCLAAISTNQSVVSGQQREVTSLIDLYENNSQKDARIDPNRLIILRRQFRRQSLAQRCVNYFNHLIKNQEPNEATMTNDLRSLPANWGTIFETNLHELAHLNPTTQRDLNDCVDLWKILQSQKNSEDNISKFERLKTINAELSAKIEKIGSVQMQAAAEQDDKVEKLTKQLQDKQTDTDNVLRVSNSELRSKLMQCDEAQAELSAKNVELRIGSSVNERNCEQKKVELRRRNALIETKLAHFVGELEQIKDQRKTWDTEASQLMHQLEGCLNTNDAYELHYNDQNQHQQQQCPHSAFQAVLKESNERNAKMAKMYANCMHQVDQLKAKFGG